MLQHVLENMQARLRFRWWAPHRINQYPSFSSSHSQYGEDMVAGALFPLGMKGTYVDIGAHHPVFYSNTYHFYRRGWSGLVVDATSALIRQFAILRPRDTAVCACVGAEAGKQVTFYRFKESPYDTIDPASAADAQNVHRAKLIAEVPMLTQTVQMLIDANLPSKSIDLMSIDIEGMDEAILRSKQWRQSRPRVLIFERHGLDLLKVENDSLLTFMFGVDYELYGKCGPSVIMRSLR